MDAIKAERAELVPVVEAGGQAGKLAKSTDLALEHIERFFEHAKTYDLDDPKLARLANDAALGVLARSIRVQEGEFRARQTDALAALFAEIAAARLKLDEPKT